MSNQHTFRSTKKSQVSADSFINKSHSFDSVLSNKKYYNVVLTGFSQTTSIFTKFIQRNIISVSGVKSFVSLGSTRISSLSRMTSASRIASSVDSLTLNFAHQNRILFIPSEQKNMGQAIFRQDNRIRVSGNETLVMTGQKFTMPQFVLTANADAFHYFYVSEWDSYLMSDLDAMNLSSMDYEVV